MLKKYKKIKKILIALTLIFIIFSIPISSLWSIKVGSKVGNVRIRDSDDEPSWIPGLGRKVVTIFYTDPDVKDQNDPFADKLKAAKLPKKYYQGIGIANLEDTWKPDSLIRVFVRSKEKKYKSTILTDPEHILKKRWGLRNCNEKSVVIVIGVDRKVYYMKYGKLNVIERAKAFKIINELIEEAKKVAGTKKTSKKKKKK
jgi:predicted transcriptional regulator